MSEELKQEELQEQVDQLSEDRTGKLTLLDEQITQELVKANVTQAIIADLKDRLMPLNIKEAEDKKATYLSVKDGRKECKALRVLATKICKKGREAATKVQKAWIKKEEEVTGQIGEVEDYLEKQEVEYEAEIEKEKEARKRKQDEQLITRQQVLVGYGALFSDGKFVLGDVSFEFSLIKESDDDVWKEAILPKYEEEYNKIQAEQLELDRKKKEAEDELKRQQEELEQKQKKLAEKEAKIKEEEVRQAIEADKRRAIMLENRTNQITALGFKYNGSVEYHFHEFTILIGDVHEFSTEEWDTLIADATEYVNVINAAEAAAQKREQERKELQNKRYAELLPFDRFGEAVAMDRLWDFPEHEYLAVFEGKKAAFQKAEEERSQQIAEAAAKKERERIEEEQRQAEAKKTNELRRNRTAILKQYNADFSLLQCDLGEISEEAWANILTDYKDIFEETKRKEEEERKAEELAKAGEKVKWAHIIERLSAIEIPKFVSGQYAKKAAILREKLEEIKAL